jgi:AcrR family transcriptional regulator
MEQTALKQTADIRPIRRKPESLSKLKRAARKLFVERGYHATRPQDIAREAGLGHGTFYLHYPDKKACFLAFVDEARDELHEFMIARQPTEKTLEATIAANLKAIYEYSAEHPGVLAAAMTDELVIDAEGAQATPLLVRWGFDWGEIVREAVRNGQACNSYNPDIVGQAILGAIHQVASEGARSQRGREEVLDNLTRFLVKALKP